MPNWVHAGFNVTGEHAEIERFRTMMIKPRWQVEAEAARDWPSFEQILDLNSPEGKRLTLDFNGIIPMPPASECPNPEKWAVNNWGTKWNAHDVDVDADVRTTLPGKLWFQFSTAWDFPMPVFEALADEFPGLVFSGSAYEESGEFELVGEINGADTWGPGKIDWVEF